MADINDIVEECAIDQFYVFRGHEGATAIELVYHGNRWVFDEPSRFVSLVMAKLALKTYRAAHELSGFWPDHRWATMTPVFADTRDSELRALAEIDRVRFAPARLQ